MREWPVFEFEFKFESHPTIEGGRQREWVYISTVEGVREGVRCEGLM